MNFLQCKLFRVLNTNHVRCPGLGIFLIDRSQTSNTQYSPLKFRFRPPPILLSKTIHRFPQMPSLRRLSFLTSNSLLREHPSSIFYNQRSLYAGRHRHRSPSFAYLSCSIWCFTDCYDSRPSLGTALSIYLRIFMTRPRQKRLSIVTYPSIVHVMCKNQHLLFLRMWTGDHLSIPPTALSAISMH
jgi:hypothetical protein